VPLKRIHSAQFITSIARVVSLCVGVPHCVGVGVLVWGESYEVVGQPGLKQPSLYCESAIAAQGGPPGFERDFP
jgi:hypothetical protein